MDNLPNKMTYLGGWPNLPSLGYENGVADVLNKIPTWDLTK